METFAWQSWLAVMMRVGALFTVLPIVSSRNVPRRLKVALVTVISWIVAVTLPASLRSVALPDLWSLLGVIASEIGVGLLLGFSGRMAFYGLDFGGALIASQMGLNAPPSMDPITDAPASPTSTILHIGGVLLWLSLDLHHWMIACVQQSYSLLPVAGAGLNEASAGELLARVASTFWMGTQIAAPVLAVSFVVTLVMSVLGRAVPQMNIFSESFAFRLLAGMGVMTITLPLVGQHAANYLRRLPDDVLRLARLLAGG